MTIVRSYGYAFANSSELDYVRVLVDDITTCCVSEGWTVVESRLAISSREWTLLQSPSGTLNSGSGYIFAISHVGQRAFTTTILADWDATNKRALTYPGNGATAISGSGTANNSYAYLPGSDTRMLTYLSPPIYGFNATNSIYMSVYVKEASLAVAIYDLVGGSAPGYRYAMLFSGEFDSILASDPYNVAHIRLYTQARSSNTLSGRTFDNGMVLTDPQKSTSNFFAAAANIDPLLQSGAITGNQTKGRWTCYGWAQDFFDDYSSQRVLNRAPVYTCPSTYNSPNNSVRGFFKNFYNANSYATAGSGVFTWSIGANSYSGGVQFPPGHHEYYLLMVD